MMRLKLAIRNITRHRLRSLLSISMIAGAVAAMILFQGFSAYSLAALKFIAAENQYGNMQIAAQKYWSPGKEPRAERLFLLNDLGDLKSKFPQVEHLSGRLSFFGLISNGDLSVGGKIIGVDPVGEPEFKKSMLLTQGRFFDDSGSKEVVVGKLLAKQMNVNPGDNITVLTNTIDGVMNAMDLTVSGVFSAGIDEIDSQVMYLPLSVTQEVLDTKAVDIAVLKFKELDMAEASLKKINTELKASQPNLFARSWRELAVLFRQVDKFYGVQNSLIEAILLALTFLGILNTVSMTVVERTGEIGTLRALGESRKEIVSQFVLESILLAIIGVTSGILFSGIMIEVVEKVKIMTEMPGASTPFQIKIYFMMSSVIYASCLASVTTVVATLIPALRASRLDIVEALRKNI
ncbi:FtsX-like permease family protein [Bacteriovorax sp. PP10]|uniref:FtsX-like permease family protein n=1 Tax=Bacteriovorax antarcticus TaxID=3088717 RepID=A0ABU5VZ04_9BACT|nr:FtsX-like permease family protein [Bacteriovorax sp. PP10]MEA9357812.1 FtsX-like permease family protein [Bacteriovorax sp. PP10]